MNDVFISYSRRDKEFTKKLYEALKAVNRTVWADWDSIPAASDWFAEIKEGIEQTDTVLFVLSPEWIKSTECRKELEYAVQMGKRLFPIIYLPVDPNAVPPELAKINWVYMREGDDFDKAFQTLCSAMDTDLEWIKAHTRIQVRAIEWDKKNRDASFALRGNDLTDGEQFISGAAHKSPEPTALQGEYVLASRKDANRRQRMTMTGVTIALVVSIALGVVAFFQRQAAVVERDRADLNANLATSRELASASTASLTVDPERSILLALQGTDLLKSIKQPILPEVEDALRSSVQTSRVRYSALASTSSITSIAYTRDGKYMAVGSWDGGIKIYDIAEITTASPTGSMQYKNQFPVSEGVKSLAFSPDGSRLLVGGLNGLALVLSVKDGSIVFQLNGHTATVRDVAYSPTGDYMATGSEDGSAIIWDANTGKQVRVVDYKAGWVQSVAFNRPYGDLIAIAHETGQVMIEEVATGKLLYTAESSGRALDVAFSPGGQAMAWSDDWGNIRVLNLADYRLLFTIQGHTDQATGVAFSSDSSMLATSSLDKTVTVYDPITGALKFTLSGNTRSIYGLAFSPDGKYIATGNDGGEVKLWDASPKMGGEAGSINAQQTAITGLAYSPDGSHLVTTGDEAVAGIHTLVDGRKIDLSGNVDNLTDVAFSPDGKYVVTGSWWNGASVWDVNGQRVNTFYKTTGSILSVTFSPDGKLVAGGLDDGTVVIWDASSGKEVFSKHFDSGFWVNEVAFSPDGKMIAAADDDWYTMVWEISSGKRVYQLEGHTAFVKAAAFSPDGKYLVTGGSDALAILWDMSRGTQVFTLTGHGAGVVDVAFNSDGTRIATVSQDGTVKVWETSSGRLLFTLSPNAGPLNNVAFSPSGKALVVGGNDGVARLYYMDFDDVDTLARTRITRSLTELECKTYLHVDTCPAKP